MFNTIVAKQAVLSALASNGLTVKRTLLWNSSPRFVDLTSYLFFWKPLTMHRLVDHVQILQNELLTRHGWTSQKTVPPPDAVHQREIQFCLSQQNFTTDYYRVYDHQKWFLYTVFTDCKLSVT